MSCERWEWLLSRFLDDELAGAEKAALEKHLGACPRCREELATFRELSSLLSARTEPDPFFVARFRAKRDRRRGEEGSWLFWRRLAIRLMPLAVAALLGAAATVWLSVGEGAITELEARELGNGFTIAMEEEPYPVLRMAFEPFPGGEP